jgi:uncharacterized membrane protein YheB (UPF0754 family)
MNFFLQFAVPPLAGALIGFVTNLIAIKMLFRPLCEYRVFGIRVPFTPGILPRQRHKLADSIGAMVERELLTPELLRQRLAQADLREKMAGSISAFTGKILKRPLGDFLGGAAFETAIGQSIKKRLLDWLEKQYPAVVASLTGFLRTSEVHQKLEYQGRIFLTEVILKLNVFQRLFLSAAQYDRTLSSQMPDIIDELIDRVNSLLTEDEIRLKALDSLESAVNRFQESLAQNHEVLGTLLSIGSEEKAKLDQLLCSRLLRLIDEEIEGALHSINVRDMVSRRINELDMERVERIVLDVMANQLQWINVFGAILGFLIGSFQVLMNLLIR